MHDLTRDFEEVKKAVASLEQKVNAELQKLNSQINLGTIKSFSPLLLESISVYVHEIAVGRKKIAVKVGSEAKEKLNLTSDVLFFEISDSDYKKALELLEAIAKLDKPVHQQNIAVQQKNKEVFEAIVELVKRAGIKAEYFGEIKVGRKRKTGWTEHEWVKDIRRQVPPEYPAYKLDMLFSRLKEKLARLYEEERDRLLEEERERKRKEEKKEATLKFARLLVKYNLPDDTTPQELLRHLLEKNRYLFLAHYLYMNRCDWSDGCLYAEEGLDFFREHMDENNPVDAAIYGEISEYVDNWSDHGDGRVFRDCEWNYDRLYGMVKEQDPELYDDYFNCEEIMDKLEEA